MIDRLLRVLAGELLILLAIFWLSGTWQIVFYVLAGVTLVTALTGFCALYILFGVNTNTAATLPKKFVLAFLMALVLIIPSAGTYGSIFFTKKFFLEDFNAMNNFYKQVLFNTGQEKRQESIDNYDKLVVAYTGFEEKYRAYQPLVVRKDKEFVNDLGWVEAIIKDVEVGIRSGDLKATHTKLEEIRPIWQEIFKRNGFSMLAVVLVDFHDSMEKVLELANEGKATEVIAAYAEADQKLQAVEVEANDDEIKAIRTELNKILEMAKSGANKEDLAKQSAVLKASFVKVYLKRG